MSTPDQRGYEPLAPVTQAELHAELANLRSALGQELTGLRIDIRTGLADLETRLTKWIVGLMWKVVGVTLAAITVLLGIAVGIILHFTPSR